MGWVKPEQQDATKLSTVVGQTFTILDFEKQHSRKFDSDFVLIDALDSEGNEVQLMGGGWLYKLLDANRANLPDDVVVTKFETDKGSPGYGLEPVDGYVEA